MWNLIATIKHGRSIVMATHVFPGLGEVADRLVILDDGVLIRDTPVEVLQTEAAHDLWAVTMPRQASHPDWLEETFVIRRLPKGKETEWRVLCRGIPVAGAKRITPTLEDLYLWVRWQQVL